MVFPGIEANNFHVGPLAVCLATYLTLPRKLSRYINIYEPESLSCNVLGPLSGSCTANGQLLDSSARARGLPGGAQATAERP